MNKAGLEIFDQVSCYRVELGQTLQQLMECYSVIFLKQFEVFMECENQMQKSLIVREEKLNVKENNLRNEEFKMNQKT